MLLSYEKDKVKRYHMSKKVIKDIPCQKIESARKCPLQKEERVENFSVKQLVCFTVLILPLNLLTSK